MKKTLSLYWCEKTVSAYLEEAAAIHRRLPDVTVPGYRTLWPQTMADSWKRVYDTLNGKTKLGSPMPPEVTFHEDVMAWLRYLEPSRQQVVWMRVNRVPWKIMVDELERSKQTLWRDMRSSLGEIAARLNVLDPQGEYFVDLRCRANGAYQHSGTDAMLQTSLF